jgi:hypothetical protein
MKIKIASRIMIAVILCSIILGYILPLVSMYLIIIIRPQPVRYSDQYFPFALITFYIIGPILAAIGAALLSNTILNKINNDQNISKRICLLIITAAAFTSLLLSIGLHLLFF